MTEFASGKVASLFSYSTSNSYSGTETHEPPPLTGHMGCFGCVFMGWCKDSAINPWPHLQQDMLHLCQFAAVMAAGYCGFNHFTARKQPLVVQFYGRFADCGLLPVAWVPSGICRQFFECLSGPPFEFVEQVSLGVWAVEAVFVFLVCQWGQGM